LSQLDICIKPSVKNVVKYVWYNGTTRLRWS